MEIIKQEILNHQERLSRANIDFLEFIQNKPGALKRSSYTDLMTFDIGYRNIQPWPTFISRQVKKQLEEASTGVFHLIRQIPERIFANNPQKIGAYFGYPEKYVQFQLEGVKDGHIENLLARGDFIFSSTGIKCLEYNVSTSLGGWQLPILEAVYLNNPIIAKFLQEYQVKIHNKNLYVILLQHLFTAAKKRFPLHNHREINIVFAIQEYQRTRSLITAQEYLQRAYQQVLKAQDHHWNGTVIFCDFPHLTVDNDCFFYKGKRIHMVVEWYDGRVPIRFFYVSILGNVMLCNGLITSLLSNKLTLALLSENEATGVFTPEEREIIKTHIPWTRRIVPGKITFGTGTFDLENFLVTHREKLVIKPAHELGGKDIQVGKFTPADQWEEAVGKAFRDETRNWLVQEYVEPLTHLYQYGDEGYAEHQTIWGLFVFGSQYAGGFLRLMPKHENSKGVINTQQGAKKTVLFEVDE